MVETLRIVLGDQLSHNISSLKNIKKNDKVLMMEVLEEVTLRTRYSPGSVIIIFFGDIFSIILLISDENEPVFFLSSILI